jgi:hypothetical protein
MTTSEECLRRAVEDNLAGFKAVHKIKRERQERLNFVPLVRKMANGLLGQLHQLVGWLTVGQVVLILLAAGLGMLVVDYTRVLLLRRKMASTLSPVGAFTDISQAARPIPFANHRKYSPPARPQAMDLLRATSQRAQLTRHHLLDGASPQRLAQ